MAHPQGRISWNKCEYKRMNLRWVEEVGPQPQSDSKWLRDNFCLSSQKWLFLAGFDLFWCSFFIVTHIHGQTMYILQKNCPQTSFPGSKEAPNILHSGKMLAPHFKDEIASLQKLPFLAGFRPFLEQSFYYDSYL